MENEFLSVVTIEVSLCWLGMIERFFSEKTKASSEKSVKSR